MPGSSDFNAPDTNATTLSTVQSEFAVQRYHSLQELMEAKQVNYAIIYLYGLVGVCYTVCTRVCVYAHYFMHYCAHCSNYILLALQLIVMLDDCEGQVPLS